MPGSAHIGLIAHARGAVAAMIGILLTFWSMLELSGFAPVDVDAIVLSVVVAVMLTRRDLGSKPRDRAVDLGVLAAATVAAALVGLVEHEVVALGELLFVGALAAFVWLRRFGPRATRLGTIATLPFIATLVTPLPIPVGGGFALWAIVGVLIAFGWASAVQWVSSSPAATLARPTPHPAPPAPTPVPPPPAPDDRRARRRLLPSTRMALQLAVSLAAAFAVGHLLFPDHLVWPVITAFIVCSGNRGRGDVVYKGVLRVSGGLLGTVVATVAVGLGTPGGVGAVIGIFVLLAVALWLRPVSYAWWAACITAVLALLYGYFGQTGAGVLESRLLGVLWGGAIAIVASWFVLPVRTTDVLRRRSADALRALTAFVTVARDQGPASAASLRTEADLALDRVEQLAPPLRAARRAAALAPGPLRRSLQRRPAAAGAELLDLVVGARPELHAVASLGAGSDADSGLASATAAASPASSRPALTLLGARLRAIRERLASLRRP
ncbi:FUSC family protein [Herbiconiux sp. 11R-BC]|uniref:FUSC family protein n=1 Tax=Herbiconiux sp. 11R-BC TaxID=3111637 RepID=UPI003C11014A